MNKIPIVLYSLVILLFGYAALVLSPVPANLSSSYMRTPFSSALSNTTTSIQSGVRAKVLEIASSTGAYLRLESITGADMFCFFTTASTTAVVNSGVKLQAATSTMGGHSIFEIYGYKGEVWCVANGSTSTISTTFQ